MNRITPAVRLSIGLIILVVSILLLAQALGLTPNSNKQQLEIRQHIAETLSSQVSFAIMRGDDALLSNLLDAATEQNKDLQSAGVRTIDGVVLLQTKKHQEFWSGADSKTSTPTHIRIPLIMNGIKRANFEISFKPLNAETHPLFHISTFVVLIIFVSLSGFFSFWLYIRRVLKYLDPNAVVPARVRNALNILAEGVLILDRREQIVLINTSLLEKLDRPEQQLIGKKASTLGWKLGENQEIQNFPWLVALHSGIKQAGVRIILKNETQKQKVFRVNAVPIQDANGASQGTIAVFDDVSELEEKSLLLEDMIKRLAVSQGAIESKNKELSFLATRDPLTNCLNRRALHEQLEGKFEGGRKTDNEFCCIMADIDHFKRVNDTYGHGVGDEVIKMAANSLRKEVRDIDLVARIGGEEFCVILLGTSLEPAHAIAERCRKRIEAQTTNGVKVTSSFGVTSIKLGATTPKELLHQADEALYFSKENGRNRATKWNAMKI